MTRLPRPLVAALFVAVAACGLRSEQAPESLAVTERRGIDPASPLAPAVLVTRCERAACALHAVDPLTGRDFAGYAPLRLGRWVAPAALSPDGRTLAHFQDTGSEGAPQSQLHLIDLEAWQETAAALTLEGWTNAFTFSPDGGRLALVPSQPGPGFPPKYPLALFDIAAQRIVAQVELDFVAGRLGYTADGRWLMVYGADNGPYFNGLDRSAYAALLDADDLSPAWTQRLDDVCDGQIETDGEPPENMAWLSPAAVFAPDKAVLYVVHADQNRLTQVDFAARRVHTADLVAAQSWLDHLIALTADVAHAKVLNGATRQAVLSRDGTRLFVVGQARDMAPDPNGEWGLVETSLGLQSVLRLDDRWLQPSRRLDGRPIVLSSAVQPSGQVELAVFDPASLDLLHAEAQWMPEPAGWLISEE